MPKFKFAAGNQTARKHGMSNTPEYKAWACAKSRCYRVRDPKYPLYGGRGITMCDKWKCSFAAFFCDMGPRPSGMTLDRINGEKGYDPSNCQWASYTAQNRNRPRYNRLVTLDGKRMTVAEAAEKTGVNHATILGRLNRGHSEAEACPGR